MALSRRARLLRYQLDQTGYQRQALRVVRRKLRIARLAEPGHVADHRDWAHRLVLALQTPRGDRRVVLSAVEREVHLHVPAQAIRGPRADSCRHQRRVRHGVRDDVPVARRRLRVRPVRPELGEDTGVVGLVDALGRIGLAGERIHRVAMTVIRPERVVPEGVESDVDRRAVRKVELAAHADDADGCLLVRRVLGCPDRRWAWVDRHPLLRQGQREAPNVSPLGADEGLHLARDCEAVLCDRLIESEGLPERRVVHRRPRLTDDERRVDGRVALVCVVQSLERAVLPSVGDSGGRDPVPESGRRVSFRAREVDAVAERPQRPRQLGERHAQVRSVAVAPEQEPVSRVADRGLPRGLHVCRLVLLRDEVAVGLGVVGGPRVPHRRRDMEEVARMRGRRWKVTPDRLEHRLVPHAGHRVPVQVGASAAVDQIRGLASRGSARRQPWDGTGSRHPRVRRLAREEDDAVGGDVAPTDFAAPRVADDELTHARCLTEAEMHSRILRGEVARARLHLACELPAVRQYGRDDGTGREPCQPHFEPVPLGACAP